MCVIMTSVVKKKALLIQKNQKSALYIKTIN